MYLRQSTASQEILLGKFVDDTDGKTAETGLTIANTDIKLFKHGATTLASKNSGGATHIANGHYYAVLDATDTDTLGNLEITVDVAGALSVRREYVVLPAMVFDSLILGTDVLQTDVTQFNGTNGTFASGRPEVNTTHFAGTAATSAAGIPEVKVNNIAAGAITATSIAADAITDAKVASDVTIASVTGAVGSVTGAVGSVTGAVGSVTGNVGGNVTGSVGSVVGAVGSVTGNVGGNVVGSVGSVTGAVASVTGNVGGNVTGSVGSVATGGITAASIADGAIDRATFAADTGLQPARSNTAQAGAAGTITLDASASATTNLYNGSIIYLTGGTGAGQIRIITAYNGATKVATISPNWTTNPDATSTFAVLPAGMADLKTILGVAVSTTTAQLGVNAVQAGGTAWGSGAITAAAVAAAALNGKGDWNVGKTGYSLTATTGLGNQTSNITGNLSGSVGSVTGAVGSVTGAVGSVTGAVGSVTGNVGGNVTGSVGSVATGGITAASLATDTITAAKIATDAITAAKIAADAIGASELAADAVTEIQSGLATSSALSTAQTDITTIKGYTDDIGVAGAGLTALASAANLSTAQGNITSILADTNELQTDWVNGGRLDLILDARASQTSVDDLPTNAELATALGTADDAVLAAISPVATKVDELHKIQGLDISNPMTVTTSTREAGTIELAITGDGTTTTTVTRQ